MVALAGVAKGQGTPPRFRTPATWYTDAYPWGVAAADALGAGLGDNSPDGHPDLAITISQYSAKWGAYYAWTGDPGEIWIYRNTGAWTPTHGGFSANPDITIILDDYTVPCGIEWAQMDTDPALELVVAVSTPFKNECGTGPWGMYVYKMNPQGQYIEHSYQPTEFPVRELTVKDFNNDGYPDVAAAVDYWEIYESCDPDEPRIPKGYFYVSLNDQAGHLLPETVYDIAATDNGPMEIVSGQFDLSPGQQTLHDLFLPIARGNGEGGVSYTNTGNGVFSGTSVIPMCGGLGVDLHFRGMAKGKFAGTHTFSHDIAGVNADAVVRVLHGDGNAGFTFDCEEDEYWLGGGGPPEQVNFPDVATGNLNGGTDVDLVVSDSNSAVHLLLGEGDGTFKYLSGNPLYVLPTTGEYPSRVITADLDGNGFDDIIVVNHADDPDDGSFNVFLNILVVSFP